MSCDGNREKHFRAVAADPAVALSLGAGDPARAYQALDAVYDTASRRTDTPPAVADALTRLMFAQMRQSGLTPPTHAADGLPKPHARQGYAAIMQTLTAAKSGRALPALARSASATRADAPASPTLGTATAPQLEAYGGRRSARTGPDRVAVTIGGASYVVVGATFTTMKDAVKDYVERQGVKPAIAFDRTAKTWNVPGTLADAQAALAPYSIAAPPKRGDPASAPVAPVLRSPTAAASTPPAPPATPLVTDAEDEEATLAPVVAGRRISPTAPPGTLPKELRDIIARPLGDVGTLTVMTTMANGSYVSPIQQAMLQHELRNVADDIQKLYRRKQSNAPLVVWARDFANSPAKRHAFSAAILTAGGQPRCGMCGQWMAVASGHVCLSKAIGAEGFNARGVNRYGITRWGTDKDGNPVVKRRTVEDAADDLIIKSDPIDNPAMAELWGRIASAVAGHNCTVVLRPGGFATDMRGTIYADPYPLGKDADPRHNLVVTKAGIYHEIGHELTTPPEDWAYLLEVAAGKQDIPGIDKGRRFITRMYNIIEDGRMERDMAARFAGVAETLAAQCAIYPRWGERVGPGVDLADEVVWPLLYTALPYFDVRDEVRAAMTPAGRELFEELEPIARRGALGTPEDSLAATIEITRRLEAAGLLDVPETSATAPPTPPEGTKARSGPPPERRDNADNKSVPPEGKQASADEDATTNEGAGSTSEKQDDGKEGQQSTESEEPSEGDESNETTTANGNGNSPASDEDQQQKARLGPGGEREEPAGTSEDLTSPVGSKMTSEALEDILNDLEAAAVSTLDREATRQGRYDALGGLLHIPLGGNVTTESVRNDGKPEDGVKQRYRTPSGAVESFATYLPAVKDAATLTRLATRRPAQREIAGRLARRLDSIRQEAQTRLRYEPKGTLDRRRFVAAVRDADNVRTRTETTSDTGMAVSVLLDQSGSMNYGPDNYHIRDGRLYDATCILGQTFEELGMPYEVRGHGGASTQYKAMDDPTLTPERAASLTRDNSGSNAVTAPVVGLALTSLLARPDSNKLIINLMDGEMDDPEPTAEQYTEARKQGVITFGVFLGNPHTGQREHLDRYFGRNNWRPITALSEMPAVIGKRIADIFDALGGDT